MSTGNLNLDIFLSELLETVSNDSTQAVTAVKKKYPSLSDKEAGEICALISALNNGTTSNAVSLAVTAPPSFAIKAKSTKNTVDTIIKNAKKSILITGYSLSEYFDDLVDVIIKKSQSGVFVEFFINNIESQKNVDKLSRYKGRFLRIYNYAPGTDIISALHAKVISVDGKVISVDGKDTLITSANLSYHGQEGNIELGTLIQSSRIAKQVKDVFTQLVFKKVFVEVDSQPVG